MRCSNFIFFVSLWLCSCSIDESSRYRDTSHLELPPALLNPHPATTGSDDHDDLEKSEEIKGLGDAVYLSPAKPLYLKLKQPIDIAWNTVASALRQGDFEIKDRELDKGRYYLVYDPDQYVDDNESFIDGLGSLFVNDYSSSVYLLTLSPDGDETLITADKAQSSEQNLKIDDNSNEDDSSDEREADERPDGHERLLLTLYQILHDKLRDN